MPTPYAQRLICDHLSRWKLYLASLRLQALCGTLTQNQLLAAAAEMTREKHQVPASEGLAAHNAEVRTLASLLVTLSDVQALSAIVHSPAEGEQLQVLINKLADDGDPANKLPTKVVSPRRTNAERAARAAQERNRRAAKRATREERTDLPDIKTAKHLLPIAPDPNSGKRGRGSFTAEERQELVAEDLRRAAEDKARLEAQRGTSMFG